MISFIYLFILDQTKDVKLILNLARISESQELKLQTALNSFFMLVKAGRHTKTQKPRPHAD